MKSKTVNDILVEYLEENDFDGLVNPDNNCGCTLDDLNCCDECCFECLPAYKVKPTDEFIDENGESDWMMSLSAEGRIK